MPILRGECGRTQPIVSVGLSPVRPKIGSVEAVFEPQAFPVTKLRALLDTGADGTSVCRHVVRSHELAKYGRRDVYGVGGSQTHNVWGVHLGFFFDSDADFEGDNHQAPGFFMHPDPLLAVEIGDFPKFDVIVGRDILEHYRFSTQKGMFEFEIG